MVAGRPAFPLMAAIPVRRLGLVVEENNAGRERQVDAGLAQSPPDSGDHPTACVHHIGTG